MNFPCRSLAKLLYVFVGNTSGLGVFANKRLRSPKRILHRPWSRWRSMWIHLLLTSALQDKKKCISECLKLYAHFILKVSGLQGAMSIMRMLKQRGVQLSFVLDEGLAVLDGVVPGLEGPAALWGPATFLPDSMIVCSLKEWKLATTTLERTFPNIVHLF